MSRRVCRNNKKMMFHVLPLACSNVDYGVMIGIPLDDESSNDLHGHIWVDRR